MQSLLSAFSQLVLARPDTQHESAKTSFVDFKVPQAPPTLRGIKQHQSTDISSSSSTTASSLKKPSTFQEKYTIQDMLGVGGFGHIYSCIRNSDGKKVAAKFLPRDKIPANRWAVDPELGLIPMEAFVLKNVQHEGIVEFYELFIEGKYVIIVQELFGAVWNSSEVNRDSNTPPQASNIKNHRSMDLFELLDTRRLSESEIKLVFKQVVETVAYLYHHHGLLHGDLKDENILIDENLKIKLIDFGGAIKVRASKMTSPRHFHGTLEFASPEVLKGQSFDAHKAECWSLGVFLYGIMYGTLPFSNVDAIIQKDFKDLKPKGNHPLLWDLVAKCLVKDTNKRASLYDILAHPWLQF